MKSVKVFIYSYKNKNLLSQVKDIVSKQSDLLDVRYYIFDQNNVDRDFYFKDIENVNYNFVHWDDYKSRTYYRNVVILNEDISDYFFEVDPNVSLMKSWDIYLSSVLKPKSVISGKGFAKLSLDRHLVIPEWSESKDINITNYIDLNLIFLKLSDALMLTILNVVKGIGQELLASVVLSSKGYSIESLPSLSYSVSTQDNSDTYVPYSVIHGYNQMLGLVKEKDNKGFEDFHVIKISDITKMPYEINDVEYLHFKLSLENLDVPRFLSGYRGVQIT
jgi:hypothetical protein